MYVGGDETKRRLDKVEAHFWDIEAATAQMSREMEDLLTTYDQMVSRYVCTYVCTACVCV